MKWEGHEQSSNVEDRRSARGGGGLGGLPIGGRSIGIGTVAVALVAGWVFGINPLTVLGLLSGGESAPVQQQQVPTGKPAPGDPASAFVATVLKDTEQVWGRIFQAGGGSYREPVLVLFRGATETACGTGSRAMGPFYCPGDTKVYIDLDFFDTLQRKLGAPGDFARAYVVAHEVAHHVQNQMGITGKVEAQRARASQVQGNRLSVRVELQADCFAGIWAHHSQQGKGWLEKGDIEEAMNAASQIGDDALQGQRGGAVVPDSFTHGSSEQRVLWFRRGLDSGSVAQCNTFDAP